MPKANRRKQAAKKASAQAAVLPSDAALIAAAPDLLEALEAVMATRTTPWRKDAMKANQLAIAAIAKARGE